MYRSSKESIEPSSPMTFTYAPRASHEDTRSVASSHNGPTQRINQIQPTAKIVINIPKPRPHSPRSPLPNKRKVIELSPKKRLGSNLDPHPPPPPYKPQPKNTSFFNFDRFNVLCGVQPFKMGDQGCLCKQPCRWRKQWTKNKGKNDLSTFKKLLTQKPTQDNYTQIQKDLPRTYPQCPTFSLNLQFRSMLKNVLLVYSIYDIQMGYVQGLNMITAVLLYHIKNPEQTFWALVQMMEDQELRMVYLAGFQHLKTHTENIIKLVQVKIKDLHLLMQELDIIPQCFLNGWLLSLMSNCITIEYMPEVVGQFRKDGWKFIYRLVITYLMFLKEKLMLSQDQSEFLETVSSQAGREVGMQWGRIIDSVHKVTI